MLDLASPLDGFGSPFGALRGFSPRALFSAGEPGGFYDPSDFGTMFQDNLGATPVTAVDQTVGLILDKSGRGNNLSQSNASFKPLLKQDASGLYHLLFDGTDDFLATSAIDFTSTSKMSAFAGVRKLSDATVGVLIELSSNSGANSGTIGIFAPATAAGATYSFRSRGTGEGVPVTPGNYAAPATTVLSCLGDISADGAIIRANGAQVATAVTDQGSGAYGNHILYVGRRGGSSLPFNGRLYSLILRGAASSALEIANTETYVNRKTGAY